MTRLALGLGVFVTFALTACLQTHDGATQEIGNANCVLCHRTEYDGTSSAESAAQRRPDHAALGYATTCADCHVTTANPLPWKLATDHNGKVFAIDGASPHKNIACTSCHNVALTDPANPQVPVGSSVKGANTDCTSCHLDDANQKAGHAAASGPVTFPAGTRYAGQAYSYLAADHRFCLDFHPNGTVGAHNESIFPSNHKGTWQCADCHQAALGPDTKGMNAPCVNSRCHTRVTSGEHGDGPNVTDPGPTSCLGCHPRGQGAG